MTKPTSPKYENNVVSLFGDKSADDGHPIVGHFFNFFDPYLARTDDQVRAVLMLRHAVFCRELGYDIENKPALDTYDDYAYSCFIHHYPSDQLAGTLRVIHPTDPKRLLPFEEHYRERLSDLSLSPGSPDRPTICELSRIAIPESFRRRKDDQHQGAAFGAINQQSYSEEELRCFPLIVISLYMCAFSVARIKGISHGFAMLDPILARSIRFLGIQCEQIGPTIDLYGPRAAHYFAPSALDKMSDAHMTLLDAIQQSLTPQFDEA